MLVSTIKSRRFVVLISGLAVIAIFFAAVFLYQRYVLRVVALQANVQADAMVRPHSPVIGPENARVTIVEFFDPACEACKSFHPYLKQTLSEFPQEVRLVIRYAPLHKELSVQAINVLEAARAQGRFEVTLDALLEGQRAWARQGANPVARVWAIAQAAGLNIEQASIYVASGAVNVVLVQDVADMKAIGVRATPTFFVNGIPLQSADPNQLHDLVKQEVERSGRIQ